jgi:hypothetical protein
MAHQQSFDDMALGMMILDNLGCYNLKATTELKQPDPLRG